MPEDQVDQEIKAIGDVLAALTPLSEAARMSVLDYVTRRLGVKSGTRQEDRVAITPSEQSSGEGEGNPIHIKTLKEQKKPRSANEMAAVVAYFLANVAPTADRKTIIDQKDVETFFKIADFPLPKQVRNTLPNAKAAGYFDLAGEGGYKLNAVGHNLVAHAMPRGSGKQVGRRKAARKKSAKSKSQVGQKRRR